MSMNDALWPKKFNNKSKWLRRIIVLKGQTDFRVLELKQPSGGRSRLVTQTYAVSIRCHWVLMANPILLTIYLKMAEKYTILNSITECFVCLNKKERALYWIKCASEDSISKISSYTQCLMSNLDTISSVSSSIVYSFNTSDKTISIIKFFRSGNHVCHVKIYGIGAISEYTLT